MVDGCRCCARSAASDLQCVRMWTIDSCVDLPTTNQDKFSRERSAATIEGTMSYACKIRTHELRPEYKLTPTRATTGESSLDATQPKTNQLQLRRQTPMEQNMRPNITLECSRPCTVSVSS